MMDNGVETPPLTVDISMGEGGLSGAKRVSSDLQPPPPPKRFLSDNQKDERPFDTMDLDPVENDWLYFGDVTNSTDVEGAFKSLTGVIPSFFGSNDRRGVSLGDCIKLVSLFCDDNCQLDALRVVQRLAAIGKTQVQFLVKNSVHDKLLEVFSEVTKWEVALEALKLFATISGKIDAAVTEAFVARSTVIEYLVYLVREGDAVFIREACRCLSNCLTAALFERCHGLISALNEKEGIDALVERAAYQDREIQEECRKVFFQVSPNMYPIVENINSEVDDDGGFDGEKIEKEGGDPGVYLLVLLKMYTGISRLCESYFKDIAMSARSHLAKFWLRYGLANRVGNL